MRASLTIQNRLPKHQNSTIYKYQIVKEIKWNRRIALTRRKTAYMLLFVLPSAFVVTSMFLFIPFFIASSNTITTKDEIITVSPPIGVVFLRLTFTKTSFDDASYGLIIDVTAFCNSSVNGYYKFLKTPKQTLSTQMETRLFRNDSTLSIDTSYKATFTREWRLSANITGYLSIFDNMNFPVDTYVTPELEFAFQSPEYLGRSNSTPGFYGLELESKVPAEYVTSVKDLNVSSTITRQIDHMTAWFNSLDVSFKIVMLRTERSLFLLYIYLVMPFLGIWWIMVMSQLALKNPRDRLGIYAAAMLATFTYLINIKSFSPPGVTWFDILLPCLIGIWGLVEAMRISRKARKPIKSSMKEKE